MGTFSSAIFSTGITQFFISFNSVLQWTRSIWNSQTVHSISRNSDKTPSCFMSKIVNSELTKDAFFPFRRIHILLMSWTQKSFEDCQDSSIFQPRLTVVLPHHFELTAIWKTKDFYGFWNLYFDRKIIWMNQTIRQLRMQEVCNQAAF